MEEFDFTYNPKTPTAQIRDLATLRFIEAGESVVLHGLVGVGKSHVAQAIGHLACRNGHTVAFTKTSRLLADLAGGRADRSWESLGAPGARRSPIGVRDLVWNSLKSRSHRMYDSRIRIMHCFAERCFHSWVLIPIVPPRGKLE